MRKYGLGIRGRLVLCFSCFLVFILIVILAILLTVKANDVLASYSAVAKTAAGQVQVLDDQIGRNRAPGKEHREKHQQEEQPLPRKSLSGEDERRGHGDAHAQHRTNCRNQDRVFVAGKDHAGVHRCGSVSA